MTRDIFVEADGGLTFIHDDDLAATFGAGSPMTIRRASHVEPDGSGRWHADLSPAGGPMLGPFDRRDAALAAERDWLTARLAAGSL